MNDAMRCSNIISLLRKNMRPWGKYVKEFTKVYVRLNEKERECLSLIAGAELKYDFFCQVFEHAMRNFGGSTIDEKRIILNWYFVLLIFDDFDFDYRENILRLNSFFEINREDLTIVSEEWEKVSNLASPKVLNYLTGYFM